MDSQKNRESINRRVKQKYLNFREHIKYDLKWNLKYIYLKFFKILNKIRFMPSAFVTLILYIVITVGFIYYIAGNRGVEGIILNTKIIEKNFNPTDLVVPQISMTLLVLTIVSLMSNIDNKYIYGEKAIEVIFNKRGIFSIRVIFNILIFIMLINIACLIKKENNLIIIIFFLLSIFIIVYITFRFTTIYTNPEKIKSKWQIIYLKENKKHITKAKPLEAHLSSKLERFKNITVQYIRADDSTYIENIEVYFKLLKVFLFNNKNLTQEYYTEMINYGDFIAHISVFAEILYKENKYEDSIRVYSELYRILNYYEIVLVDDIRTNSKIDKYIDMINNVKTKTEMQEILFYIFPIIKSYWQQIYLYTKVDLSYCRLSKKGGELIYYFTKSDILEKCYCVIKENKNLNKEEKKQAIIDLYDQVRVLRKNNTHEWYTVTNFKNKDRINRKEIIYPNYLYSEPIILMILKSVEKKDLDSFKLFLSMNLETELINYIKVACLMSLLEAAIRGNKNYYLDIDVTIDELKNLLKILNFKEIKLDIDELDSLYNKFMEIYNVEKERQRNKKYVYSFHPRLVFNESTIQSIVYYIAVENGIEKKNEKINSLENESSKEIFNILYE